jgi:predicted permease
VLLAAAGLLLRSLYNLESVPLGMDASGVVTAGITLNTRLYPDESRRLQFFEALERQARNLPGVTAFGISDSLPPAGRSQATIYASIQAAGMPRTPQGTGGMVAWRSVTPGYFAALGIPVERGRAFTEQDRGAEANVAILSHALAQRLFPNDDPLGKSVRFVSDGPWFTIVGVAGDVKNDGVAKPAAPEYYLPRKHSPPGAWSSSSLILRTPLNPAAVASWLRSAVASLDSAVPVTIDTLDRRIGRLQARPRFNAVLLGIFAAVGVLLAGIGTFGVLGFLVAQRTHEIGIRLALGAQPRDIWKLALGQVSRFVLLGVIIGVAGAFALTRWMTSLLFHVSATDPYIIVGVAALLLSVSLAACYVPARRAVRVDPMKALRVE